MVAAPSDRAALARRLVFQAVLWAVVAWLVAAVWAMKAQSAEIGAALSLYYSVRAPLVGVLAGLAWAPLTLRQRGGRPTWVALTRGALLGQCIGASATVMLLAIWPNDMQNSRWDAFKWGYTFWRLYWYLFVPSGVVAGALSVLVGERRRAALT